MTVSDPPAQFAADEPKDAVAYTVRGVEYHKNGHYDNAIEDYTHAIRLDSSALFAAKTCRLRTPLQVKQVGAQADATAPA